MMNNETTRTTDTKDRGRGEFAADVLEGGERQGIAWHSGES
jgi:hypothetical protein